MNKIDEKEFEKAKDIVLQYEQQEKDEIKLILEQFITKLNNYKNLVVSIDINDYTGISTIHFFYEGACVNVMSIKNGTILLPNNNLENK